MKNECILICRVSSAEQVNGYSLPAQERMGKEYINEKGFRLIHDFIFQESASKTTERKKFDEVMAFIYGHVVKSKIPLVVVVEKKDRWGRLHSRKEAIQDLVLEGKVIVHYFRERQIFDKNCSPEDIFMDDVVTSLNKYNSKNIGKEAKKGMTEKAIQGWLPHKPPLGYLNNPDKTLGNPIIVNEFEKKLVYRIFELRADKNFSYAHIANVVKEENLVPLRRLHSFRKSTVEKVLKNSFYAGKFTFSGIEYNGNHELIVPHVFIRKVHEFLNQPGVINKIKSDGIYSDFFKCGECGCKITYHQKHKESGRIYHLYVCANGRKEHKTLKGMYVKEEVISAKFDEMLDSFSVSSDFAEEIAKGLNNNHIALQAKLRKEESSFKIELKKLEVREDQLYDDLKNELIIEEYYKRRLIEIRKERDRISDLLIRIESSVSAIYLQTAKDILELAKNSKLYWNHLSKEDKVQMIKKVVWNPRITNATIDYEMKKPFKILVEMRGFSDEKIWGG